MPRRNIKHPAKENMWRCWSTIVDDWVSDWLSAEDYKNWLISEAAKREQEDLNVFGIRGSSYSAEECEYDLALKEYCENCGCNGVCDDCKYNISYVEYKSAGDDYFHISDRLNI